MSGASLASLDKSRAQPKRQTIRAPGSSTRGWSPPTSPRLQIGRADDACEAEADAAADRVLAETSAPPAVDARTSAAGIVRPRSVPGTAGGVAPPDVGNRIAAASDEGRPLPQEQRGFFEGRFAHDFADVRVHDGPASARAAASASAQAFTLGRDIYFGAGQYRPHEAEGRHLLAHELAHTIQQRPGIVARRALPSAPPLAAEGPANPRVEEAADDLSQALQGGGTGLAADRVNNLDPELRTEVLARLRARLPAGEGERATKLSQDAQKASIAAAPAHQQSPSGDAARGDGKPGPTPGERDRGVEARAAPTAPAPVQGKDAAPPQGEPPVHEQATMAATSKMQEAVRSVGGEPSLGGAVAPAGVATEASGGGSAGEGAQAEGAAATAAQKAVGLLGTRLAELEEARSAPVRFQQDQGPPGDPEAAVRAMDSASLASSFVSRAAARVRTVIDAALKVPGQAMTSLGAAQQAVAGQIAAQSAAIHDGADQTRKRVRGSAGHVRGSMDAKRSSTDSAAEKDTSSALERAQKARDKASGGLDKRAEKEKSRITQSYREAVRPMIAVGVDAGGKAKGAAATRQSELLAQRNGESSILDGPIHDDRLEANAEASGKVAEEYDKSFRDSARQQSGKLADSKPEILGKVDEITREAGKGYTSQFEQIQQGASAFEKGAKAQSKQSATQIKGGLEKSAAQSLAGLDAGEQQQTADLVAQGTAAQSALDQSVAAGLSGLANGVAEASGQLTGSIRDFTASVAEMRAPQRDELSTALDDASANVDAPLAAMAAQITSVAPTLATTTDATRDQSEMSLAAAAGAARQGFDSAATGFAGTAGGMNQQAAKGFKKLGEANKTSTQDIGKQAEDGFVDAEKNASEAYGKFGDQVEDNFRVGREQMLGSLWGKESQDKLDADMKTYGQQAADQVQPRWKRVLKWVVTIVVIVAVIAITVLSAGSLGPVGVVLLGAALGAAAGAVQTIANNLIDGKKWSDGVVKAMIVGAIGGAVGGAGGVLLKGVGSVALKIGLEAGVNFVGGVAGEVIGSVATGETVNWTGAVMGALIGAGIGAGLGIAGALKGKIKIGGFGKSGAPPAVRPTVEPLPPAPAGKLRGFLEQTKILAPRPGAAPKVSVGAAAVGEPAAPAPTLSPTPEPAVQAPKRPIGFQVGEPSAPSPTPAGEPAVPAPKRPIGFQVGEPSAPIPTPTGEPAVPAPKRPIGFQVGEPPAPTPTPTGEPAVPAPKRPIGFQVGEPPAPSPTPAGEPALPAPKRPIGFQVGEPPAPTPTGEPTVPRPKRPIGFNTGEPPAPSPTSAPTAKPAAPASTEGPVEPSNVGPSQRPQAMIVEPSTPRTMGGGAGEPIRAGGGSSLEVQASGKPGAGGPKKAGGGPQLVKTTPPNVEPVTTGEPAPSGKAAKSGGTAEAFAAKKPTGQPGENAPTPEPAEAAPTKKPAGKPTDTTPTPEPSEAAPTEKPAGKPTKSAGVEDPSVAGKGKKSAGTNEPREAETGTQKEARELGADRPQRPPQSDKYFDYEGGDHGSFFQFVKRLKGHFDGLGGGAPAMDESVLRKKTGEFLKEKGLLADYWEMLGNHQKKMNAFEANYPNARASDGWKQLQGTYEEMQQFLNGKLGAKRPDLVELKLGDGAVDVTDITQKFGQEFHEFKTKVYKELLGDLFPSLKAGGLEYGGVGAQKSL